MKRGLFIFILIQFAFILSLVSSAGNLLLDNSTWNVASIHGGGYDCSRGNNNPETTHDENSDTYSERCWFGNLDYFVELTFPSAVLSIEKINFSYDAYIIKNRHSKVEVFSEGAWNDVSAGCVDVQVTPINAISLKVTSVCSGNWVNIEKIRVTLSGFMGISGPVFGDLKMREISAFGPSVTACVPDCSSQECGIDPNCGTVCGDCNELYSGENRVCQVGSCVLSTTLCYVEKESSRFYRFWDTATNQHFYTSSKNEKSKVNTFPAFVYEGVIGEIYNLQAPGTIPLYRLWNSTEGWHIYTNNSNERDNLISAGLIDEGIAGYIYDSPGADRVPLHRFYSDYLKDFFYTTDEVEKQNIGMTEFSPLNTYEYNGVVGYLKAFTINDSSQVIMRLDRSANSQNSLWDQKIFQVSLNGFCKSGPAICEGLDETNCKSNPSCGWFEGYDVYKYPAGYVIYHDEIFNFLYLGNAPHGCSGENKVLGLEHVSNSQSEIPGLNNYGNSVCYGNLVCENDASPGELCADSEKKVVARLKQDTDSNISDSCGLSFPIKICCYSSTNNTVFWADTEGNRINNAELGDTVKLVYKNSNLPRNQLIDFEIFERDGVLNDEIRTLSRGNQITATVDSNGDAIASWRITESDLSVTQDLDNFSFRVNGIWSDALNISNQINDTPMILRIISPKCADYFNASDLVKIKIEAMDDDDVITGEIKIYRGNTEIENLTFNNGVVETDRNFMDAGNYQISVEGVNTRGKTARKISNIMVINISKNDFYVSACIDSPEDFTYIDSAVVEFDARSTRGVHFLLPDTYDIISKENLNFYWNFSDGRTNPVTDGSDSLSYYFNKTFSFAGNNSAFLNVEIKNSYSGN
ncbi:MAG: hypothetical protein Q8N88_01895 [Nanoarchaeota archaeon]|nr:hypothetical protein [Nanoarchaeota archaeon]